MLEIYWIHNLPRIFMDSKYIAYIYNRTLHISDKAINPQISELRHFSRALLGQRNIYLAELFVQCDKYEKDK